MDLQKLCGALRRGSVDSHRCLGCSYEANCSLHGCQIMKQAADMLEDLQKRLVTAGARNQAVFKLGQLDMKESIVTMLQSVADEMSPNGVVGPTLRSAADLVRDMEVP